MIQVTVRFFAATREAFGAPSTSIELPDGATVAAAWQRLIASHPALDTGVTLAFAVNRSYAEPTMPLRAGDELAIIPPVSGG
jgi:molybdopterin converting factor subunit 1